MKRIFSAHNDEDEGLDGLELYKAIKHAKSHETTENGDDQTDEEKIQSKVKFLIHFYSSIPLICLKMNLFV